MPKELPNIIFIMADDMGYGDVSCYNPGSKIQTPNMDRLAAGGVRFTDAHSSSAVCTPSRYSVLTGRYCWRTRLKRGVMGGFGLPLIDPARLTVASLLKKYGYNTGVVGKWHVGLEWHLKDSRMLEGDEICPESWQDIGIVDYEKTILQCPLQVGFDYFFGIAGSLDMPPYTFIENNRTVGIPDIPKREYFPQQKEGFQTENWDDAVVDIRLADKAVEFINNQAKENDNKPFFLYYTPAAPHRPCLPPEFAQGKSSAGNRGDMVWIVDHVVGRVMDALEQGNLTDNTLIIVTSDNGAQPCDVDGKMWDHKSCGDWRGYKAQIWDGGHREPFIVHWPSKVKPGSVCDSLVGLFDTMATCAEIVGEKLPANAGEDSVSFLHLLLAKESPGRNSIVHHSYSGTFSYRRGKWKLICGLGDGNEHHMPVPGGPRGQLYNLNNDPGEKVNLWLERQDLVKELSRELESCRAGAGNSRTGVDLPQGFRGIECKGHSSENEN